MPFSTEGAQGGLQFGTYHDVQGNQDIRITHITNNILGDQARINPEHIDALEVLLRASEKETAWDHDRRALSITLDDTRVVQQIQSWIESPGTNRIFWIHGASGTGKTYLMRALSKALHEKTRLGASFFFPPNGFNDEKPSTFFTTIAYHLHVAWPAITVPTKQLLKHNLTLPFSSLREQLQKLIVAPLTLPSKPYSPVKVVVIDGLERCGNEEAMEDLANLLTQVARMSTLPLLWVISSESESSIGDVFEESGIATSLDLSQVDAAGDVEKYLQARLARLAHIYKFKQWPKTDEFRKLVELSHGLFLYASYLTQFIEDRRFNPRQQLRLILSGEERTPYFPHKELDGIYKRALQRIPDAEYERIVRDVVGFTILSVQPIPLRAIDDILQLEQGDARVALRGLHCIYSLPNRDDDPDQAAARLVHVLFRQYITQKERSAVYYIDPAIHHGRIAQACLVFMKNHLEYDLCDLKDSPSQGPQDPELAQRITARIEPGLQYGIRFWSEHLKNASIKSSSDAVVVELESFVKETILYWVESLSLLGAVEVILPALRNGINALKEVSSELSQRFVEAESLLRESLDNIRASALHGYTLASDTSLSPGSELRSTWVRSMAHLKLSTPQHSLPNLVIHASPPIPPRPTLVATPPRPPPPTLVSSPPPLPKALSQSSSPPPQRPELLSPPKTTRGSRSASRPLTTPKRVSESTTPIIPLVESPHLLFANAVGAKDDSDSSSSSSSSEPNSPNKIWPDLPDDLPVPTDYDVFSPIHMSRSLPDMSQMSIGEPPRAHSPDSDEGTSLRYRGRERKSSHYRGGEEDVPRRRSKSPVKKASLDVIRERSAPPPYKMPGAFTSDSDSSRASTLETGMNHLETHAAIPPKPQTPDVRPVTLQDVGSVINNRLALTRDDSIDVAASLGHMQRQNSEFMLELPFMHEETPRIPKLPEMLRTSSPTPEDHDTSDYFPIGLFDGGSDGSEPKLSPMMQVTRPLSPLEDIPPKKAEHWSRFTCELCSEMIGKYRYQCGKCTISNRESYDLCEKCVKTSPCAEHGVKVWYCGGPNEPLLSVIGYCEDCEDKQAGKERYMRCFDCNPFRAVDYCERCIEEEDDDGIYQEAHKPSHSRIFILAQLFNEDDDEVRHEPECVTEGCLGSCRSYCHGCVLYIGRSLRFSCQTCSSPELQVLLCAVCLGGAVSHGDHLFNVLSVKGDKYQPFCDKCGHEITAGQSWRRCLTCPAFPGFDICGTCAESSGTGSHEGHRFALCMMG